MKRSLLFLLACTSCAAVLTAAPSPTPGPKNSVRKSEKKSGGTTETVAQSAHGWSYVKGEWIHPDGYKFVKGQVLRTTAKAGRPAPEPPGKLALENAEKLTPKTAAVRETTKTATEKAAEERQKNLAPRPAPQTGSHL